MQGSELITRLVASASDVAQWYMQRVLATQCHWTVTGTVYNRVFGCVIMFPGARYAPKTLFHTFANGFSTWQSANDETEHARTHASMVDEPWIWVHKFDSILLRNHIPYPHPSAPTSKRDSLMMRGIWSLQLNDRVISWLTRRSPAGQYLSCFRGIGCSTSRRGACARAAD